jgi:hypothetical protein
VGGNYTQASDASLEIELGGVAASAQHDVLIVGGTASLAGKLDVVLWQDFEPSGGDYFSIFQFTQVTNTFDLVNLPALGDGLAWDDSLLYSTGSLSVVPEPGSILLGGISLSVVVLRRHPPRVYRRILARPA